jgi:uncharacterized protein YbgA (DUF1722 family)
VKEGNTQFHDRNYKISENDVIEYVLQQFQEVKRSNKIKNLVTFQAANKYMVMAHDQAELKNLGNIVASYKKIPFSDMLQEYEDHFRTAMTKEPTVKTHTNVIMHIFGYFSKYIAQNEKQLFFELLEQFRENKITLGNMLLEISCTTYRFDNTYLASQTYFLLYSNVQPRILFQALDKMDVSEEFNS